MLDNVPYGYCGCGCGEKTTIATRNHAMYGMVKGQPMKFISGHAGRKHRLPNPNPSGLCQCGCGQKTTISTVTIPETGIMTGYPRRYISGHAARKLSLENRFWSHVKIGEPDECWEWQAGKDDKGYGGFSVSKDRHHVRAHRFSYELSHGTIPDGLDVLHKCDNPPCVDPNPLFLGTQLVNMRDMTEKGRGKPAKLPGEKHPNAKITDADAVKIKEMLRNKIPQKKIAGLFGISPITVSHINTGISWGHIE